MKICWKQSPGDVPYNQNKPENIETLNTLKEPMQIDC